MKNSNTDPNDSERPLQPPADAEAGAGHDLAAGADPRSSAEENEPAAGPENPAGNAAATAGDSSQPTGPATPRRRNARNRGRFQPGQSGNPAGRPPGRRNQATMLAEALLEGEAEALVRATIDMALLGKPIAMKLCLERLLSPRREREIHLDLPALDSVEGVSAAIERTIAAVAAGTLTPHEGETVIAMLRAQVEVIKTESLEQRLAALEAKLGPEDRPQLVPRFGIG